MSHFDLQFIEQFPSVGAVFYKPSMPSTSDVAKEKILENPWTDLPLLVLCDQQTAGRGQPGKSWDSDSQSLTFTWCIPAESLPAANHAMLPLIAGVSVCEAFDSLGIENANLKWPNDVLIERKKVCGILVERISSGDQAWFLIGIGINVNQDESGLAKLSQTATHFPPTSLRNCRGSKIENQSLLKQIAQNLHNNVTSQNNWAARCQTRLEFLGEPMELVTPDGATFSGTLDGIDEQGWIKILVEGKSLRFPSGQLSTKGSDVDAT